MSYIHLLINKKHINNSNANWQTKTCEFASNLTPCPNISSTHSSNLGCSFWGGRRTRWGKGGFLDTCPEDLKRLRKFQHITLHETHIFAPEKWIVGRLVSFWDGFLAGAWSNRQYLTYKCVKIFQFGVWMVFCWMIFRGMPSCYLDSEWFFFDDLGWNCLLQKFCKLTFQPRFTLSALRHFPSFVILRNKIENYQVNKNSSTKKKFVHASSSKHPFLASIFQTSIFFQ